MKIFLEKIKSELKHTVLKKYSFIKDYKIIKIYSTKKYLGYYKHHSIYTNIPIIKLNIPMIKKSIKKYNLPLYDILITTILHELAHSIQQYKGNMGYYDEIEAENFAYNYFTFGKIIKIKKYN